MDKQEMVRININILGISELTWTRIGKFNSDDHYIYYFGKKSFRRNGVALTINKSLKYSTWVQPQKWQNDLGSFPKQTIQHHSNPSLCLKHWCQRSWSWPVLWSPIRPSKTNTHQKDVLSSQEIGKVVSQEIPWATGKFCLRVQNEAGKRLTEFCQENTLVIGSTLFQQHKWHLYTWMSPDDQYQNKIDYILFSWR